MLAGAGRPTSTASANDPANFQRDLERQPGFGIVEIGAEDCAGALEPIQ